MQALRYFELVNHFESNSDTEDEEESTILEESNNALQSKDTLGSNLALLRLSKHIHEEATTFLYSQNIFGFFPSWRLPPSSPTWEPKSPPSATIVALRRLPKPIYEKVTNLLYSRNPFGLFPAWRAYSCGPSWKPDNLPSAAILDCITNVEFHLGPEMRFMSWCTDTDETLEFCRKKPTDSILPGPVALFTGTDTRRRSALIEIKPRNWSYYTTHITPSPLFAAIGQLTGFGKVTVRLHAHAPHFCPLEGLSDVEVRDCAQRGDWGMVFGGLMYMMEASRVRLERTLGRGVWGELVLSPSVETRHPKGWRDLVFWPGVEGVGMGVGG